LVQRCGAKKIFINFIIELGGLNGRKAFPENITVDTLLTL
jgi:adenine phosphoribosyltransferase